MSAEDTTTEPPTTTEPELITWENVTPEQYESRPFISGWPWCAPGEYPESYAWEAPCSPVDPCLPGGRTLWTIRVCEEAPVPAPAPEPTTISAVVGVQSPATMLLPSTGVDLTGSIGIAGTICLALGLLVRRLATC